LTVLGWTALGVAQPGRGTGPETHAVPSAVGCTALDDEAPWRGHGTKTNGVPSAVDLEAGLGAESA
jgi:hypothetical protein